MLFRGSSEAAVPGRIRDYPRAHLYETPRTDWKSQVIHKSLHGLWWLLEFRYSLHYDNDEKKREAYLFLLAGCGTVSGPFRDPSHGSRKDRRGEWLCTS